MNWGDLKTQLAGLVHRKDIDFNALQPFACQEMTSSLDVMDNEGIGALAPVLSAIAGIYQAPLPADFARIKAAIAAASGSKLAPIDVQAFLTGSSKSGYCSVSGGYLYCAGPGAISLVYCKKVEVIAADDATSAILTNYPAIYLYAMAVQAFNKVQDFDAKGEYEGLYRSAIMEANATKPFQTQTAGAIPRIVGGRV